MTTHAVIHAIPDGSRLVSAFAAYTSGSRHRTTSDIVTSEGAERVDIIARRKLGDRRDVLRGETLRKVLQAGATVFEQVSGLILRRQSKRTEEQAYLESMQAEEKEPARGARDQVEKQSKLEATPIRSSQGD